MLAAALSASLFDCCSSVRRDSDESLEHSRRGLTDIVAVDCGVVDRRSRSSLPCEIDCCSGDGSSRVAMPRKQLCCRFTEGEKDIMHDS